MSGIIPVGYCHYLPCGMCRVEYRPDISPSKPWVAHWNPYRRPLAATIPFHGDTCEAAAARLMAEYPCGDRRIVVRADKNDNY